MTSIMVNYGIFLTKGARLGLPVGHLPNCFHQESVESDPDDGICSRPTQLGLDCCQNDGNGINDTFGII